MSSKGVDTLLELRRQLQEKSATLVRQVCGNICYGRGGKCGQWYNILMQVEEEQRRVERLEQESAQVHCNNINTRDFASHEGMLEML